MVTRPSNLIFSSSKRLRFFRDFFRGGILIGFDLTPLFRPSYRSLSMEGFASEHTCCKQELINLMHIKF
jgi:hypothetical protein